MSAKTRVDLFFDVISPYSWIGFEALTRYRPLWTKMDLRLRPFHFPAVIKASGNVSPPMLIPIKEQYLYHDLPRAAKHFGLTLTLPPDYKKMITTKSAVGAQRALVALEMYQPQFTEPVARELWLRLYSKGLGVFTDDEIGEALALEGVTNVQEVIKESHSDVVKQQLRENTEEALNEGCFGAPWVHVHTSSGLQKFFGSDRMPQIADCLGVEYKGPNPLAPH